MPSPNVKLLALAWLPLVLTTAGVAQRSTRVPSIRVRITNQVDRAVGVLTSISADSVYLLDRRSGEHRLVALDGTTRLELSRGRSHRLGKAALYGSLIGAASGGLQHLNACNRGACSNQFVATLAVNTVVGLSVGSIAGALLRFERWEPIDVRTLAMALAGKDSALAVVAPLRRGHAATGLLAGVGIGAATSLVLIQRLELESSGFDGRPVVAALGVVGGGTLGAIVGGLIRTTPRRERTFAIAPVFDASPSGALRLGFKLERPQ